MTPTNLTAEQKLQALAHRFYQGAKWEPKAGDYYTSSRADLELYQVVDVRDGKVFTRYLVGSDTIAEWDDSEFLADHTFGRCRVFVPAWVLAPAAAMTKEWFERKVALEGDLEIGVLSPAASSQERIAQLEAERDALVEALSPSASTKAAYIGEFHESIEMRNPEWDEDDDEPEYVTHKLTVSWDTIKAVMAAISARAAAPERIVGAAK